ncbi:hypothetical protein Taro_017975 [Colocasia esculenta]|uniref:Uncharacterized protein n=1 Tax=Colocasia esculenta TaxID=4460 RepID=A0A843UQ54_COLES|nr:hypothetical protein [Colocasia esculenta]
MWLLVEVVSIAWDPHPRELVEGVLWATSMLELGAELADSRVEGKTSHVVVLGVGPQLGQAAVVCALLWCSVVALSHSSGDVRGRRQAGERRGSGRCVLLLVASGCALVVVVVLSSIVPFLGASGRACGEMSFSHGCSVVSVRPHLGGRVEACFLVMPDSIGFCGNRVCVTTLVGGLGIALFSRGSSSRELDVGWVVEAAVAPCAVSSNEGECCELLYLSELRVVFCKFSGCLHLMVLPTGMARHLPSAPPAPQAPPSSPPFSPDFWNSFYMGWRMALAKVSRRYGHKGLTNIRPDIGPEAEPICSSSPPSPARSSSSSPPSSPEWSA